MIGTRHIRLLGIAQMASIVVSGLIYLSVSDTTGSFLLDNTLEVQTQTLTDSSAVAKIKATQASVASALQHGVRLGDVSLNLIVTSSKMTVSWSLAL
jgi:hypothetical protein